jgi:hypothetical protein
MTKSLTEKLCSVERDRMTAAEICIDELLTIMDRHRDRTETHSLLRLLSDRLSVMLLNADGPQVRRDRLIRVRLALTEAFPMTDEDLLINS